VIAVRRDPLPGGGFGFWLEPDAIAPRNDPAWDQAGDRLRTEFWKEAGLYASRVWKRYRAAGFDRLGEQMDAISILTAQARQDDIGSVSGKHPYSPMGRASVSWKPLQATGGQSRLQSLLRWQPQGDGGVWFYWAFDRHTRHYWGEILARHARGFRQFFRYPRNGWGRVPARDVLGFSDEEIKLVREWMAGWWAVRRQLVPAPTLWGQRVQVPAATGRDVLNLSGLPRMTGQASARQQIEHAAARGQWTGWRAERGMSPSIFARGRTPGPGQPPTPPAPVPMRQPPPIRPAPLRATALPTPEPRLAVLSDPTYETLREMHRQAIERGLTATEAAAQSRRSRTVTQQMLWRLLARLLDRNAPLLPPRRAA
jgi:hypothetical protein